MPSKIKRGQTVELTPEEVAAVLASAGMKTQPHGQGQGKGGGNQPRRNQRGNQQGQRPRQHGNGGFAHAPGAPRERGEVNGNSAHAQRPANGQKNRKHGGPNKPPRHGQPGQPFHRGPRPPGQPRFHDQQNRGNSPVVRTTLTIPGAIPEGLPGTTGPRPGGGGHQRAGKGPRGKGPREQRPPRQDDDDRGNRGPASHEPAMADEVDGNR